MEALKPKPVFDPRLPPPIRRRLGDYYASRPVGRLYRQGEAPYRWPASLASQWAAVVLLLAAGALLAWWAYHVTAVAIAAPAVVLVLPGPARVGRGWGRGRLAARGGRRPDGHLAGGLPEPEVPSLDSGGGDRADRVRRALRPRGDALDAAYAEIDEVVSGVEAYGEDVWRAVVADREYRQLSRIADEGREAPWGGGLGDGLLPGDEETRAVRETREELVRRLIGERSGWEDVLR